MKHAFRVATAAAAIATGGLFAGTAAAAGPPLSYDDDILSQFNANNSYETVRHLAVDIGPRRSGLPEEDEAAEYLAGVLRQNGFEATVYQYPFAGNRPAAKVTSPDTVLPNGPNWQLSFAANSKITTNAANVTGEVLWVNGGALPADFPAAAAGKIVMLANVAGTNAAAVTARTAVVGNAVAAGASAVILVGTGQAPPNITINGTVPDVPVVGGGDLHGDELKKALCPGINPDATPAPAPCATQSKVTLKIVTNNWGNLTRAVVIGRRKAVNDPTGTKAPIVMVGAHIDSVLGAPGAHDDATGNGVSMEIARVVGKLPLDKEIRIGGFGGEEDGLQGSRAWTNEFLAGTLNEAERKRFVGEWQMDMVGTPYEFATLWALTPDGKSNFVVDEAYKSAARFGFTGLRNCRLGQSDHQAFFDLGIPSALFIWLDYRYRPAPLTCESPGQGTYQTEPEYHTPRDGMNNVSTPRMQIMLDLIGSSFAHNAMNRVDVTAKRNGAPAAGAPVTGDCGDGVRNFGVTDAAGYLEVRVPHVTCNFKVGDTPMNNFAVDGDKAFSVTLADGSAGATVPATLSLTLGPAGSFGAFTPGITKTYTASTTATVISTAGDAKLTVSDPSADHPGHLVNGTYFLPEPLKAAGTELPATVKTYTGPVSNDAVPVAFTQLVNAGDALRTGSYSKTLTFTLSTTNP